jgi:mono/diheme cytochrome c family protein
MVHSTRTMAGLLKLGALVVVGIGLLVVGAAVALFWLSQLRLNASVSVPADPINIPTDVSAIQRGQHIAGAVALCTQCHGPTLSGGIVFDNMLGQVVAPNLTRGGAGASFRDADYVRAIRYGVDPSGRQLWSMPTGNYNQLSDDDLADLIAYLKSLPPSPAPASLPPSQIRPLGRVLFVAGGLDLVPAENVNRGAPRPAAVGVDLTPAYGQYLVTIAGCGRCHGAALTGGRVPGSLRGGRPAPSLSPSGLGNWSQADFVAAMRTGRRPDASAIDTSMPWPYYAQMSDLELDAIWAFLGVMAGH